VGVSDVARNEPVAVESDDDDVENGRSAAEHVGRYPQIADALTERPAADHLILQQHIHTRTSTIPYRPSQLRNGLKTMKHNAFVEFTVKSKYL